MLPQTTVSHPRTPVVPLIAVALSVYPLLYVLGAFAVGSVSGDPAKLQLLLFPLLLVILSRVSIGSVSMPTWVLGIAAIGCVGGAIFTYTHVDLSQGAFAVARFDDDELEAATKITRDRIRGSVGAGASALVGSHHESVSSSIQARSVLEASRHLGGLVWGSPRWLTVSLAQNPNLSVGAINNLGSSGEQRAAELSHFTLIASVGEVGLSNSSDPATVEFIGRLIPLWSEFGNVLVGRTDPELFEQRVRALALVKSRWTAFSHRALPMWMTGTFHLARVFSKEHIERGELSCALAAFEAARAQLRPGDNAELEAAILNNQAIALLADALVSSKPQQRRMLGVALLRSALVTANAGRFERVASVVQSNLKQLRHDKSEDRDGRRQKQQ